MTTCKTNKFVSNGLAIIIQVSLVFAFLTIFFFTYVKDVEKREFGKQMDIIVDDLFKSADFNINQYVDMQTQTSKEDISITLSGMVAMLQQKITIESKEAIQSVVDSNNVIKTTAFTLMKKILIGVIIALCVVYILGYCNQYLSMFQEIIIAVIVVASTELAFLEIVTAKYITASPSHVKQEIGKALHAWLVNNNKIIMQ